MEIKISENNTNGIVFINEGAENLAEMTWVKASDEYIIVDHTMVGDSLKGQGIGRKLLDRVVAMARERNLKILPLCPFVKVTFDRVEEFRDLRYE